MSNNSNMYSITSTNSAALVKFYFAGKSELIKHDVSHDCAAQL